VIQQNASISEEFSATSEEIASQAAMVAETTGDLASQATRLDAAVGFFKLGGATQNKPVAALPRPVEPASRSGPEAPQRRSSAQSPAPAAPSRSQTLAQPKKNEEKHRATGITLRKSSARSTTINDEDFIEY